MIPVSLQKSWLKMIISLVDQMGSSWFRHGWKHGSISHYTRLFYAIHWWWRLLILILVEKLGVTFSYQCLCKEEQLKNLNLLLLHIDCSVLYSKHANAYLRVMYYDPLQDCNVLFYFLCVSYLVFISFVCFGQSVYS